MSRPLGSTHSATQEPSVSLGTVYKSSTLKSFATFRLPAAGLWASSLEQGALPIINERKRVEETTPRTRIEWSFCMGPRMAIPDPEGKPARAFAGNSNCQSGGAGAIRLHDSITNLCRRCDKGWWHFRAAGTVQRGEKEWAPRGM